MLESIYLSTSQFDPASIQEILRSLPPTLQELRLQVSPDPHRGNRSKFDDTIFDVIIPVQGNPTPLPALRVLQIHGNPIISDGALLQFILARQEKLRSIQVQFARAKELAPLIENGLKLSIRYTAARMRPFIPWDGLPDMREMTMPPGLVLDEDE